MVLLYTTYPSKARALTFARAMVKKKYAACFNIMMSNAVYQGEGMVDEQTECVVLIKTQKKYFLKIQRYIKKNHPYKIPCLFEIPLGRVDPDYHAWLTSR